MGMPLASTFSTCGATGMPGTTRCRPSTMTFSPALTLAVGDDAHAALQRAELHLAHLRLAVGARRRRRTSCVWSVPMARSGTITAGYGALVPIVSFTARPGVNWPLALSKLARRRIAPVCALRRLSTKSTRPACGWPLSLARPMRTRGVLSGPAMMRR